jgi:hypothetical protein
MRALNRGTPRGLGAPNTPAQRARHPPVDGVPGGAAAGHSQAIMIKARGVAPCTGANSRQPFDIDKMNIKDTKFDYSLSV